MHVAELLDESLRWADRPYLVCGDLRISFSGHRRAVYTAVRHLVDAGVSPGDRVLIIGSNSPEFVVMWWATVALGAIAVLGNRWWTPTQVAHAIAETDPALVAVDTRAAALASPAARILNLEDVVDIWDACDTPTVTLPRGEETDPAMILYTSGTTGQAKGVILSHRAVIANLHNLLHRSRRRPSDRDPEAPQQVNLLTVPLFHRSGMQAMTLAAVTGDRLVLPPPGPTDVTTILGIIERERVSVFAAVPTVLARIVKHPNLSAYDTSTVQSVAMGGMYVHPSLIDEVRLAFPGAARRVGALYGMTESGGVLTSIGGSQLVERPTSSGAPLPVVELRIANPGPDGSGEIVARSPTTMSGYWGRPDDPALDQEGWLHTGDIGRIEGGNLYLVGRLKDIIIRGGENVAATRVESSLLAHPAVLEAAVLGLEHLELGEEVAAVVVVKAPAAVSAEELSVHVGASLARFEVPSAWWLRDEPLPLNASGKVDKLLLHREWSTRSAGAQRPSVGDGERR
jgi:long-chain acyl-CoA synthetase